MTRARGVLTLVVALVMAGGLTGCGSDAGEGQTLTVLAAASLTDSFEDLARVYEDEHPGVDVRLVLDSSATLADKANDHAPGDLLATADERTMQEAMDGGGVVGTPREFATNQMVVVVPSDNPGHVQRFADLADVDYLTCVPTAPCGAAAQALLEANGITAEPVSEEVDVKAVLTKVVAGEADAGLVYRTDAEVAGERVRSLPIPGAAKHPNTYWIARTPVAQDTALAEQWIGLLFSDRGRSILSRAGFGPADQR